LQAEIEAQVQEANAQAGPLAEAKAQQDVIAEQTALAERQAAVTDKKLESEVRRPADAEAYKQRTLAEAARDATKHNTEGEAFRQRAMAEANRDTTLLTMEAEATRRRQLAEAETDAQRAGGHGQGDRRFPESRGRRGGLRSADNSGRGGRSHQRSGLRSRW
jgi:uncharacterized protein YjcR